MTETQKPVAWLIEFENGEEKLHFYDLNNSLGCKQTALYAAPVVAPDVPIAVDHCLWARNGHAPCHATVVALDVLKELLWIRTIFVKDTETGGVVLQNITGQEVSKWIDRVDSLGVEND